jgi:transcriptional regulator with XRE-family HTH domain
MGERERFGARLQRLRWARGWSQYELARRVGVQRNTLHRWEIDEMQPKLRSLLALTVALGVTANDLLSGVM